MLVSVIIPCYNAERFLEGTICSVLAQTLRDFELILIDDGSSDQTRDIIRAFAKDTEVGVPVRYAFGPNRGASAARNKGTEIAQGAFIQYLDADDLLRPTALEKRVDALQSTGGDVAYSDWKRWRENRDGTFRVRTVVQRTLEEIHPDAEIATFTSFWAPPAALLYRRHIVTCIGSWNLDLPVIQDARFLQDAARCGARFVHVPEVLADYREHRSTSLSKRDRATFKRDIFVNAVQTESLWRVDGGLSQARIEALSEVYRHCARVHFWTNKGLFEQACERLETLGKHDDSLVRLWHTCQRWGYSKVRTSRIPARVAHRLLTASKWSLRQMKYRSDRWGQHREVLP